MRNVTVSFEDGTSHIYQGVPDEITPDAIESRASSEFADKKIVGLDGGTPDPRETQHMTGNALTHGFKTAGDLALSGLSHGIVAPIAEGAAGLVARATGHDPAAAHQWAADHMVYNTQEGSDARKWTDYLSGKAGEVLAPVGQAVHTADDFIGKYGGPEAQKIARQVAGTSSDILGVLPGVGIVAKGMEALSAAARPVAEAAQVARTPDELAKAANIRVPPSIMATTTGAAKPGRTLKLGERVAGAPQVLRDDIIHAKGRVNSLSKTAAGISEDKVISPASLDAADAPHAAVYEQVRQALPEPIMLSPEYASEVQAAGLNPDSVRPLPASAQREIANALDLAPMNGRKLLGTISDYRAKGWKGLKSDDVDQQAVGATQIDIANALEKQMSAAVDARAPGLSDAYKAARVGFAKNNTIREALVGHDVDPQVIKRLAWKNEGISGELKLIADLAEHFPQVMTIKVPKISAGSLMSAHGFQYGAAGGLGFLAAGVPGAIIGSTVVAPAISKGVHTALNAARAGAANPRAALGSALADYAGRQRGFHPSQGPHFRAPGSPGYRSKSTEVAPVPGRSYEPKIRARGPATPLTNQGLNPPDRALSTAVASRHPSAARPAPLRLPAPGKLAQPDAKVGAVAAAVAKQHPANPRLSSTVTQRAEREKIDHMVQVLAARRRAERSLR